MKQLYLLLFLAAATALPLAAQELISGKVLSSPGGEPLAGAYVTAKQSRQVTATRKDGSFALKVTQKNDTLLISYIGYKNRLLPLQWPLSGPLVIRLEENTTGLSEVTVSTGYYQVPRERATGSFTRIGNETISRSVSPDIVSRLKGVTNGLTFDERLSGAPKISIRGLSTIYGETQPLIVLNNFPYDGDLNSINPNDVESITILKDAAAASIWGVRAANGVIVITTKKGAANRPPRYSFNSNISVGEKPDVFYNPSISSADFIDVEKFLFSQGFYDGQDTDPSHPPLTPVVELLLAARDGNISSAEADAEIEALKGIDVRNDFDKYLYRNSLNQQYAFNVNGGGKTSTYYYSTGYDRNLSYKSDRYERFSFRADNSYSLNSRLKINPVISYIQEKNKTGNPDYYEIRSGSSLSLYPYAQLADASGNPLPVLKDYSKSFVGDAPAAGLMDWEYIPLEDFDKRDNRGTNHDLLFNLNTAYDLSKNLSAQLLYQYERSWNEQQDLYGEDAYYTRDLVNRFTQDDGSGNLTYPVPKGAILDQYASALSSHTLRAQLRYNKDWQKNNLAVIAGGEIRDIGQSGNSYRTYGYDGSGLVSVPVDYTSFFTQYNNPDDAQGIPYLNDFTDQTNRYTSYYANAAYTWDNRYIFSASGRKDASNLFGVSSNQKGVPLWSAGFSWNIHNESFFNKQWLSYLKLRLTYGFNGNLDRDITALATVLQVNGNLNNMPYALVRTYPNPGLRWEKVGVFNVGVDFAARNNVISGSVEYYSKKGRNLIGDQPVNPTEGIPSGTVRKNVADMLTSGVDVQLSSKNIDRQFKWVSSLLFNYNTNKVTDYYTNPAVTGSSYINSGLGISPVEGKPVQSIFTYRWAGLDPQTGDPIGIMDGEPSTSYGNMVYSSSLDDLQYHGPALPLITGSLGNTFSFKDVSLYINMTCRLDYYFMRSSISYSSLYNAWIGNKDFADRWQKPGDENFTSVPSMVYPANSSRDAFYTNSAVLVEKGDNIRLQDVNLSWKIHPKAWQDAPVKNIQLYAYARNLGIIWRANKRHLDPDYTGYLLPQRTISFGVKADF